MHSVRGSQLLAELKADIQRTLVVLATNVEQP
jgi:hypothetical protein